MKTAVSTVADLGHLDHTQCLNWFFSGPEFGLSTRILYSVDPKSLMDSTDFRDTKWIKMIQRREVLLTSYIERKFQLR